MVSFKNSPTNRLNRAQFILEKGIMGEEHEAILRSKIPHDQPMEMINHIFRAVQSGKAIYCDIKNRKGKIAGWMVIQFETSSSELIVLATYGYDARASITPDILPNLEWLARENGLKHIRFHTVRNGLIKRAVDAGFHVSEVILRKEIE